MLELDSRFCDYENYPPGRSCRPGNEILKSGMARKSSVERLCRMPNTSGVTRETPMERCLFACDELAGFITAVALIKPGEISGGGGMRSRCGRRMKDKAFARKVNRDDIG